MDILNKINSISYDLLYYTSFKLIRKGIDDILLFNIKKDFIKDNKIKDYILNRNKTVNNKIKFLLDYDDIKDDYDFINLIKELNLEIYIEVNNIFETNNYNMFMDIKNIIVPEEFLSTNEKYIEIWKDMNVNFIIKDYKIRINEEMLLKGK